VKGLWGPVLVIVWKDVLLELRSRDLIVSVVVFGLLVVVVFNFALNNTPGRSAELAPGILWTAFAFAAILAMNRAFVRDQEQGGLEGLLISPVSRDAIFVGKALTSLIFMLLVEAAWTFLPCLGPWCSPYFWAPWGSPSWAPYSRPWRSRPGPGRSCSPCCSSRCCSR